MDMSILPVWTRTELKHCTIVDFETPLVIKLKNGDQLLMRDYSPETDSEHLPNLKNKTDFLQQSMERVQLPCILKYAQKPRWIVKEI